MGKGTVEEYRGEGEVYLRREATGEYVSVMMDGGVAIFEKIDMNLIVPGTAFRWLSLELVDSLHGPELNESPFGLMRLDLWKEIPRELVLGDVWRRVIHGDTSRRFNALRHIERWHPDHVPYIKKVHERDVAEEKTTGGDRENRG